MQNTIGCNYFALVPIVQYMTRKGNRFQSEIEIIKLKALMSLHEEKKADDRSASSQSLSCYIVFVIFVLRTCARPAMITL